MTLTKEQISQQIEDEWDWFGDSFREQWREYGYYDSHDDPEWKHERDRLDLIWEARWGYIHKTDVPSRLWDEGTPSSVVYWTVQAACRGSF